MINGAKWINWLFVIPPTKKNNMRDIYPYLFCNIYSCGFSILVN
jgi:pantothenate kinase